MRDRGEGRCPFGFDGAGDQPLDARLVVPAMARNLLPEMSKTPIEPGAEGARTGRCLCGAVSFRLNRKADSVFANHDAESRRWTGGVSLTLMIRAYNTTFYGWGRIVQFASSARMLRGFCRACGTHMFVRHTAPEAMDGMLSVSAGTLDTTDGLTLTAETYYDAKPAYYAMEGERRTLSTAEVEAMYVPTKPEA